MLYIVRNDNPQSPDDTGTPTRVRLIGPFTSKDEAWDWMESNNPHDNPCWQTVDLSEPNVLLVSPEEAYPSLSPKEPT